jgi:hypothetical protein
MVGIRVLGMWRDPDMVVWHHNIFCCNGKSFVAKTMDLKAKRKLTRTYRRTSISGTKKSKDDLPA